MGNLPLHPVLVHFPLVLAVVLPVVVAVLLWGEWRGRLTGRSWRVAIAIAAVLSLGAFVSVKTGEREEERVESMVPDLALERHEERAEFFVWATLAPLVALVGAGLIRPATARRYVGTGAMAVSLLVAGLAVAVGESGGSLVYEHNAGAAYGPAPTATVAGGAEAHDHH